MTDHIQRQTKPKTVSIRKLGFSPMLQRVRPIPRWAIRRLSTAVLSRIDDEGDWSYSSEWWGPDSGAGDAGDVVFRSASDCGNGIVSVAAYPSSRPDRMEWSAMERWLERRYGEVCAEKEQKEQFRILGYQWRVLRFNENTRQSSVKVMAAYRKSDSASVCLMQQPHCLAAPYLKSMVSAGLTTLASFGYDLSRAVCQKKTMHVLCIGHGGGSLPLFIASKIPGAIVHIVEIDPVVISASIQAMGFPILAAKNTSEHSSPLPQFSIIDQVLWKGIHERLFLYESDAETFICNNSNIYDLVFIDAYDGDDIFPRSLWDPDGEFLQALRDRIHPRHGTVVVNLHSDSDVLTHQGTNPEQLDYLLPMGKYVSQVCRAYNNALGSLAFTVSVPWLCNTSLVACRSGHGGLTRDRYTVLNTLKSNARVVEDMLKLPFSCLQYIKKQFVLIE